MGFQGLLLQSEALDLLFLKLRFGLRDLFPGKEDVGDHGSKKDSDE